MIVVAAKERQLSSPEKARLPAGLFIRRRLPGRSTSPGPRRGACACPPVPPLDVVPCPGNQDPRHDDQPPDIQRTDRRAGLGLAGSADGAREAGELAFRVGRRELGHLHGDHTAHLAFPEDVWLELRAQNRIVEHPVFPGKPGPALRRLETDDDVRAVIELLRINYDRIVADPTAAGEPDTEGPGRPRELDYRAEGEGSPPPPPPPAAQ